MRTSTITRGRVAAALLMVLALVSLTACSTPAGSAPTTPSAAAEATTRTVKDMVDRHVVIPTKVEKIVTLGSGAPRLAAYLDVMDMLVGAEEYVKDGVNIRRDYNPVHHERLATLPFVGAGGGSGQNNGYPEEIIKAAPDVIMAGFDREAADELQQQTNIPVVSVRHTTGLAPQGFYDAMRLFGDVVHAEERSEKVLAYVDSMLADLDRRTVDVPDGDKLRAYAGAVTWNGRRGFSGTYGDFGVFNAIHAVNVAQNDATPGFYEADLEAVLTWDPDIIFLDPGNMDLVNEEYATNPSYFTSLRAVREGKVYSMPAFNNAGTNFTYAFMDAYYAGIVLFPEQFADVDIKAKSGEILTTFLGSDTFDQMVAGGLIYDTIKVGG